MLSLAEADQALGEDLSANSLLILAAVIGILTLSEDSPMLNDTNQENVSDAIAFLAEKLATASALIESP